MGRNRKETLLEFGPFDNANNDNVTVQNRERTACCFDRHFRGLAFDI